MDCSLPGFSVHGIFQARILEWVTISFSRGSSRTKDWTWVSHTGGRRFNLWAMSLRLGKKNQAVCKRQTLRCKSSLILPILSSPKVCLQLLSPHTATQQTLTAHHTPWLTPHTVGNGFSIKQRLKILLGTQIFINPPSCSFSIINQINLFLTQSYDGNHQCAFTFLWPLLTAGCLSSCLFLLNNIFQPL